MEDTKINPEDEFEATMILQVQDEEEVEPTGETDAFEETTVLHVINEEDLKQEERKDPKKTPKKKKKKKKKLTKQGVILFRILLAVSLCVCAYSGWKLYVGYRQYQEGNEAYQALAVNVESTESLQEVDVKRLKKDIPVDYDALRNINPLFTGWLTMEDSVINYPVVHPIDNWFYLEHLFTGEVNHMGCIFIDCRNKGDFEDQNTWMYAHHMRNGSMFADLEKFQDQEYYNTHQTLNYKNEDHSYTIEPFAGVLTTGSDDIFRVSYDTQKDFIDYVNDKKARSSFNSDVVINEDDKIVTMVTCSYRVQDGRFIVFAKLVEEDGE